MSMKSFVTCICTKGLLAQSAERRANNANVMSSILIQAIAFFECYVAFHSLECHFFPHRFLLSSHLINFLILFIF